MMMHLLFTHNEICFEILYKIDSTVFITTCWKKVVLFTIESIFYYCYLWIILLYKFLSFKMPYYYNIKISTLNLFSLLVLNFKIFFSIFIFLIQNFLSKIWIFETYTSLLFQILQWISFVFKITQCLKSQFELPKWTESVLVANFICCHNDIDYRY